MTVPIGEVTPKQAIALRALTKEWQSAHLLGHHLRTLRKLVRMGLALSKFDFHADGYERHCTYFKLTPTGERHAARKETSSD